MRTGLFLSLAALLPGPALAANQVALDNHVFIERVSTDTEGKQRILLADLSVPIEGGMRRAAQPADVTHLRWAFQKPIPVGGTGKLMFRGVVK